jgi:Flp pilus assembly protein TadG
MRMKRLRSESGAAAVEFALVVPLLLLLLFGIIEFGRLYNAQIEVSGAAREGVRVMAITDDASAARGATRLAAPSLNPALQDSRISITSTAANPAHCAPGATVTVAVTYPIAFLTGMFGPNVTLTGRSVMRCGG